MTEKISRLVAKICITITILWIIMYYTAKDTFKFIFGNDKITT